MTKEFIIASVECGLNFCYGDEEFSLDEEMQRKLLIYFAQHDAEKFSKIVCPSCQKLARQILMQPTIEELETKKSQNPLNGNVWCNGFDHAITLAVSLIRDGVKK